jgi:hypothetical protein
MHWPVSSPGRTDRSVRESYATPLPGRSQGALQGLESACFSGCWMHKPGRMRKQFRGGWSTPSTTRGTLGRSNAPTTRPLPPPAGEGGDGGRSERGLRCGGACLLSALFGEAGCKLGEPGHGIRTRLTALRSRPHPNPPPLRRGGGQKRSDAVPLYVRSPVWTPLRRGGGQERSSALTPSPRRTRESEAPVSADRGRLFPPGGCASGPRRWRCRPPAGPCRGPRRTCARHRCPPRRAHA